MINVDIIEVKEKVCIWPDDKANHVKCVFNIKGYPCEGTILVAELNMIQELHKHFGNKKIPKSLIKAIDEFGEQQYYAGLEDNS